MFLSVLVVPYTLFHLWSQTQSGGYGHSGLCSLLFASLYLLYQAFGLGFLPTYVVVTNSLPPASCFIVIMEQVQGHVTMNILFNLTECVSVWWDCLVICPILGPPDDESPLLCQGECTKGPDVG